MKNTNASRTFDSMQAASAGLGIPLGKLRNLKAKGADGFENGRVNSTKLLQWLKARKPKASTTSTTAPPALGEPLATGAGSALLRLETHEAEAFIQMQEALRSGDVDEVERCRKGWLEVSEQLRKGDLAVEVARRDAGAMVPREEIEIALRHFGSFLHAVFNEQSLKALGEIQKLSPGIDVQAVNDILATMEWQGVLVATAGACNPKSVPSWLRSAILSHWDRNMHGGIDDRCQKLTEALRYLVADHPELESPTPPPPASTQPATTEAASTEPAPVSTTAPGPVL